MTAPPELPVTAEELWIKERQKVAAIQLDTLSGSTLNIYKSLNTNTDEYQFIPIVQVDWSSMKASVEQQCSNSGVAQKRIPFDVHLYSSAMLEEVKQKVAKQFSKSISAINVSIPANIGIAAFAEDSSGKAHEVIVTIPVVALLRGAAVSNVTAGSTATLNGQINATCAELSDIAAKKKLMTLMFIVGSKIKVNELALAAQSVITNGLASDLKSDESKIDKTTVTNKKKGGSLAIKLSGMVAGSASNESATVSADKQSKRIINRAWLDDAIDRAGKKASILQICETQECAAPISDRLFNLFFSDLQQQTLEIREIANQRYQAWVGALKFDLGKIKMDEELKAAFKQAAELKEKETGEYQGIKFSKEADGKLTTDSDVTWKRAGDEWIPTSIKAFVVGSTELEREIDFRFRQVLVGASTTAAMVLPSIQMSTLPPQNALRDEINKSLANSAVLAAFYNRKPINFNIDKRSFDEDYQNDKSYPIDVQIRIAPQGQWGCQGELFIKKTLVASSVKFLERPPGSDCVLDAVIPPGATYKAMKKSGAFAGWIEWH